MQKLHAPNSELGLMKKHIVVLFLFSNERYNLWVYTYEIIKIFLFISKIW